MSVTDHTEAVRKIEERREDLEALAESDGPASWVAEELLTAAENHGD